MKYLIKFYQMLSQLMKQSKQESKRKKMIELRKKELKEYFLKFPQKFMHGEMNENVTGNGINSCRNTFESFDVSNLWDCKYCSWFHESKDCMDCYAWGFPVEQSYECMEVGDRSQNVLFSVSTYNGTNVLYSYYTQNSSNLFGCVGIKDNEYCILNKKYSKQEYEKLTAQIIEHMKKNNEWGDRKSVV